MGLLQTYNARRDFAATPEPPGRVSATGLALRYAMQKHDATRLHWDLRLEWNGVLLSWAVTRGPSLDPTDKRLAVRTEDHPLDYLDFEGVIPAGSYGAGRVMLWDIGHWQPLEPADRGLRRGRLSFALHGRRMTGRWEMVRMKAEGTRENWLLIKGRDEAAGQRDPVRRYRRSVATGRDMRAIGADAPPQDPKPRNGKAPAFRKPQLATLTDALRNGDGWWHELKFDGYRALCSLGRGGPRIHTRGGHDWSDRFAPLLPALDDIPCDTALLDGEIVAGAGLQGFGALQKAIKAGGPFTLYLFDLLQRDGQDMTALPLADRRARLDDLIGALPPLGLVRTSPVIGGDASGPFSAVCEAGGEGLVAKRVSAPYRGGRGKAWLKIKCERREEFVIIGWQESDKRGRPFASLALAQNADGRLRYAGKVGSGFGADTMDGIMAELAPLARRTPPADVPRPEARDVHWVEPRLVAELRYAEMTDDGRVRHAVFEGMREDKPASDVTREETMRHDDADTVAGVPISSGDREVFPSAGFTKLDVARYYEAVADRMLEEVADRPVSLVRLPNGLKGERFFQRHAGKGFPAAIKTLPVAEADATTRDYMYIDSADGIVGAAQMGTIEFHIWGSRRDRPDRPDRMVFDLDPDEDLPFAEVRRAATDMRDRLRSLGLASWPLLTGGKGIHVVIPLHRSVGWDTVKTFSQAVATQFAAIEPGRFTATMSKAKRKGRIFIDYLRNERAATAIAPYSLRARTGAPVAVPVSWGELPGLTRANAFDLNKALGRDWPEGLKPAPQRISAGVIAKLETWIADGDRG